MKAKAFATIMLTLILATSLFYIIPIAAQPEIKIGIMGPGGFIQGVGMMEGAQLAVDVFGGTVTAGATTYDIVLPDECFDEFQGGPEGTFASGKAAMEQLAAWGAKFAIGGFRTESTYGARSVSMDEKIVHLITGAATDALVDCTTGACTDCVRCNSLLDPSDDNYDRYRYLFRITPINSSTLMSGLTGIYYKGRVGFITYVLDKLAALYGAPVKFACFIEALTWAQGFWTVLTNPYYTYLYLGPKALLATDPDTGAKVAYQVSPTTGDLSLEMEAVKRSEARLIIHILSAETAGRAFTLGYESSGCKAVAVGINDEAQMSTEWAATSGAVEYQTFTATTGTRTPLTSQSTAFWDAYVTAYGHDPIYTAYGAYSAMITLLEAIENAGTIDADASPGGAYGRGILIRELEATDRLTGTGMFKFTGPSGIYHDVWSASFGETWEDGYSRAVITQWQAGRQEIVWPTTESPLAAGPYCKALVLPCVDSATQLGWEGGMMYPYPTDVDTNGKVDTGDVSAVAYSIGTVPGAARWQFAADWNRDWQVADVDHAAICTDFGKDVVVPLEYCDEAGHLVEP